MSVHGIMNPLNPLGEQGSWILQLPTRERGFGPEAWCKRCRRRHPRRDCKLVPVERVTPAGNKRIHLVHESLAPKPQKKTKARKS